MGRENQASRFAVALQTQLQSRGWGVRTLARKMVDPGVDGWDRHVQVESARRKLNNYLLLGVQPSDESVRSIEDALGLPEGELADRPDPDLALIGALMDQLATVQARRVARLKVPA